jgi:hypothetical protein
MKQNYSGGTQEALISNKKALDINQVLMEKFLNNRWLYDYSDF